MALAVFIAQVTGLADWSKDRLFPRNALVIDVELDPAVFDATVPVDWEEYDYVIPRDAARLPAPPGGSCRERFRWTRELGGVDATRTKVRVYLRGRADGGVVIDHARVVVATRRSPLEGTHAACPVGGAEGSPVELFVNLDAPQPIVRYGRNDEPPRPFLLTIAKGEIQPLEVIAVAEGYDVSWWLELSVQANGKRTLRRVDANGEPFRTTGTSRAATVTFRRGAWRPGTGF